MFWVILILFFILIGVAGMSQSNKVKQIEKQQSVEALALYEKLNRTSPDDPLVKLGQNEFSISYRNAIRRRLKTQNKGVIMWMFIGMVLGIIGVIILIYLDQWFLGFTVLAALQLGMPLYKRRKNTKQLSSVVDYMRQEMDKV